jgi:hypothetical protein
VILDVVSIWMRPNVERTDIERQRLALEMKFKRPVMPGQITHPVWQGIKCTQVEWQSER